MFTKAIVRKPGKSMIHGISTAGLGQPDYALALAQHAAYVHALEACGLEVLVLDADEAYPDSTFVEDVALLTKHYAILTNPGAPSRKGETAAMLPVLESLYEHIEVIHDPGTVEAGDIMMVGNHFYIGVSERTNAEGAGQMIAYLEKYGMTASVISVTDMLHIKTGIAYLENDTIAATKEYWEIEELKKFKLIEVDDDESYAANCIWVNGRVLVAAGYPKTTEKISAAGYPVIEVDVSEFRKLDGGLSCLSLRF